MTKAATTRLRKSEFYQDLIETVKAWDYYLNHGDDVTAEIMHTKWQVMKLALEHITGNRYTFSRDGKTYGIINEMDYSDVLFTGKSV